MDRGYGGWICDFAGMKYINNLWHLCDEKIVPVRTPPPQAADSCSRDNFWTTFWISFICGMIVGPEL